VPRRRATRHVATPMSNDCLLGSPVFVVFIYLFVCFLIVMMMMMMLLLLLLL
jgi:hypothetical protein